MDVVLKFIPILTSVVALFLSGYTLWSTRHDLKRTAERQFLEGSCTTGHMILRDLERFICQPKPQPLDLFIGDTFKQILAQKQSVLRFRSAVWYEAFNTMLVALGSIGAVAEQVSKSMAAKNLDAPDERLLRQWLDSFVDARNAVANYLNVARDRLNAL